MRYCCDSPAWGLAGCTGMHSEASNQVRVRPEGAADVRVVDHVHREAFGDHGGVVAGLLADLRPSAAVSLVAEAEAGVVGHVLCSPCLLDAPRRLVEVQTLTPLAVLPDQQRQGIGTALVRAAAAMLADQGVPVLFLEGSPCYYGRLGFVAGAQLGFRRPSLRIPEPAFQAMLLPAHEPWMTGTAVFPDVFWRHDAVGLRNPEA